MKTSLAFCPFPADVKRTDMADEKPIIDEDIAAPLTEALISIESAGIGLDR